MNTKHVLAIAAILITSQVYALTAYEKNHGCPGGDVGCSGGTGGGGGGGGDYGASGLMGVFSDGNGGTVEFYSDAGGEWWVENHADGTSQVGWDESAGPQMYKKMPNQSGAKRPKYSKAEMTAAAKKSSANYQAKAAAEAAKKAAADKAAADKAAAEKAAAAKKAPHQNSLATGSKPAASGVVLNARNKP